MSPPERAIVLCVDEKSQIQALDAASPCCRCVPASRRAGARPRWHVHLTPTSASWLNQVERFFALITPRAKSGAASTAAS
jgi:hypothetical protein